VADSSQIRGLPDALSLMVERLLSDRFEVVQEERGGMAGSARLSRAVAEGRAGDEGVVLEWQTGTPPPGASWSFEWSPDLYNESEVLIRGSVRGAKVHHMP
jgi:hypothetical protein